VLQQNQRLSAWAEQPRGGKAAGGSPLEPQQRASVECGRTEGIAPPGRWSERRLVAPGAAHKNNDMEPPCHIEPPYCVGSFGCQSVRLATVASAGPSTIGHLRLRLECVAHHGLQRGAGSTWSTARRATKSWQAQQRCSPGAALPNPSLKRSTNGMPPGPGLRYAVHFLSPGPGVLPLAPA